MNSPTRDEIRTAVHVLLDDALNVTGRTTFAVMRGGAHVALLYAEDPSRRESLQVILEHLLPFFSRDYIASKDFLVLDDTSYTGEGLVNAKRRLASFGADEARIKSAALMYNPTKHHEFAFSPPDYYRFAFAGQDYSIAAEHLRSLVCDLPRPVDGDHALYRLHVAGVDLWRLLDILGSIAPTSMVDTPRRPELRGAAGPVVHGSKSTVVKLSMTLGGTRLNPICERRRGPKGRYDLAKLRLYLEPGDDDVSWCITCAPIVYPMDVPLPELCALATEMAPADLCSAEFIAAAPDASTKYFVASTLLGFVLLKGVVAEVVARCSDGVRFSVREANHDVIIPPDIYKRFYDGALESLRSTVGDTKSSGRHAVEHTAIRWKAYRPKITTAPTEHRRELQKRTGFSLEPLIIAEVGRAAAESDAARVSFHDLVAAFGDEHGISLALDRILDAGALKAVCSHAPALDGGIAGRYYRPGGEYKKKTAIWLAEIVERGCRDSVP